MVPEGSESEEVPELPMPDMDRLPEGSAKGIEMKMKAEICPRCGKPEKPKNWVMCGRCHFEVLNLPGLPKPLQAMQAIICRCQGQIS